MNEYFQPNDLPSSDPLVTSAIVRKEIGSISSPTLWRWIKEGKFPKADFRASNVNYWRWSTVLAWKEKMLNMPSAA